MKTMNLALVIGAVLLLVLVLRGQQEPATIGRYQVMSGARTIHLGGGAIEKEPTVFKIDTVTGRAWDFQTGVANGKNYSFWAAIDQ